MEVFDDSLRKFVIIEDQISFRSKDMQQISLTEENNAHKINDILAAR